MSESGPCIYCGATNYALSMGGPTICPSCDCGNFGPPTVRRQGKEITTLRSNLTAAQTRIAALEQALATCDEALEPFATKAIGMDGEPEWFGNGRKPDSERWPIYFEAGDLRKAREARRATKEALG